MRYTCILRPVTVAFSVVAALLVPTSAYAAPAAPGDTITLPVREAITRELGMVGSFRFNDAWDWAGCGAGPRA